MDQGEEKAIARVCFRATLRQEIEIKARARAERRSVSEWLRMRVEEVLEEDKPDPRGPRR